MHFLLSLLATCFKYLFCKKIPRCSNFFPSFENSFGFRYSFAKVILSINYFLILITNLYVFLSFPWPSVLFWINWICVLSLVRNFLNFWMKIGFSSGIYLKISFFSSIKSSVNTFFHFSWYCFRSLQDWSKLRGFFHLGFLCLVLKN
jgi:hypothetical protein